MPITVVGVISVAVAFLIGSIPFGVLVARRRGVNVRSAGSGNIGATNVARTVGRRAGALVLLTDVAKGAAPVAAFVYLLDPRPGGMWLVAVGMAPIVGHCFSPWLGFRGGKGVATSLGVFIAVDPLAATIAVATFVVLYAAFRVASVGSMAGALSLPLFAAASGRPAEVIALAIAAAGLIIARHHQNLRRLFGHRELKV